MKKRTKVGEQQVQGHTVEIWDITNLLELPFPVYSLIESETKQPLGNLIFSDGRYVCSSGSSSHENLEDAVWARATEAMFYCGMIRSEDNVRITN